MIETAEPAKVVNTFKAYVKYREWIDDFTIDEIQSALNNCDSQTDQKQPYYRAMELRIRELHKKEKKEERRKEGLVAGMFGTKA
jgi:hypothetical protein